MPFASVPVPLGGNVGMLVLRQNRRRVYSGGTSMTSVGCASTWKMVPVNEFSGRPPSDGGVKAGPDVHPRDVGDVVTVALEEANRRVLGAEQEVLRAGVLPDQVTRAERPVVADLEGPASGGAAAVEARPTPAVVRVPRGVRRLE